MGMDTDMEQLSRRRRDELRDLERNYEDSHYGKGNNNSNRFTNFMLSIILILITMAIGGQIWFNNTTGAEIATLKAQVAAVQATINYMIDGRFRSSTQQ